MTDSIPTNSDALAVLDFVELACVSCAVGSYSLDTNELCPVCAPNLAGVETTPEGRRIVHMVDGRAIPLDNVNPSGDLHLHILPQAA